MRVGTVRVLLMAVLVVSIHVTIVDSGVRMIVIVVGLSITVRYVMRLTVILRVLVVIKLRDVLVMMILLVSDRL